MNKKKRFSAVIPAYNTGGSVVEALESLSKQSFKGFEVIVVNDGSTDDTGPVIREFINTHPEMNITLLEQKNLGIGGARNTAIRKAGGEWLAFLDADDRWYPGKLEEVHSFIQGDPCVDLVCHDEKLVVDGRVVRRNVYGPYTSYFDLLFKGAPISTSATVVRRSKVLEAGLFSEDLRFNGVEDYDLWLRLSKVASFRYLHKVLGEYRTASRDGITGDVEKHSGNLFNVFEHHLSKLSSNELQRFRGEIQRRRANIAFLAGWAYLKRNDFKNAKRWFRKSRRYKARYLPPEMGMLVATARIKNVPELYDRLLRFRQRLG